ncbi:hypothetical protein Hanom_Chr09g00768891 [Helianthus anomalus]
MQAFFVLSYFACLAASALVILWPATNPWSLSPTRGDTLVNSTHTCFPSSHPKTRISAGRRVDLHSNGLVKKFSEASFFCRNPYPLKNIMKHKN